MSRLNNLFTKTAFAVTAFCAAASFAQAGEMRFTLPFEATWSGNRLAPGDYTMTQMDGMANMPVLRLSGNGKSVLILVPRTNDTAYAGSKSFLKIRKVDGVQYISELESAGNNTCSHFRVPNSSSVEIANASGKRSGDVALLVK
jgi:hypothetical protein